MPQIAYEIKNVRYKKSTIVLADSFLHTRVAPLLADPAARQNAPKDVFVAVNRALRKDNEDRIRAITGKATPSILWKDAFVQLSNSKVEANFADLRTYTYNGEPSDTVYHLATACRSRSTPRSKPPTAEPSPLSATWAFTAIPSSSTMASGYSRSTAI